ncbi:MAG: bifunctional SulP family inorganic anion transporter/carbonic anhydrase [Flavobacteriales bacterium]|nr:bifunctional SulP family inorganic anion transporter/carbonic anhydrase [Flavobacteriales bacterium]
MRNVLNDLIPGLAVFLVAIPLCLGIALASGAPMAAGLIGGISGGLIIGSISGSATSVSGPAAGLAAIVLTAISEIGSFEAFLVAVFLAGVIQLIFAAFNAGVIARFFPTSVIKGLLTSIGIILVFKQIPHALGHDKDTEGNFNFIQADNENTFSGLLRALEQVHPGAILTTILCLLIMVYWPKWTSKKISSVVPASLLVVIFAILLNEFFSHYFSFFYIDQGHRVNLPEGISFQNAGVLFTFPDFEKIGNAMIWKAAITIALVASLETLLNIEASDKIDPYGRITPPNRELVAQGCGNLTCGLLGGLPITSVIVRTSVNINSGGRTKFTAIFHGVYLVVFVLFFPQLLLKIPLSALAAILIITGFKLIKRQEFKEFYAKGTEQFLPFIITILAIVFTDLLLGVIIGLITALFYIIRSNFRNPFTLIREEYQNKMIYKVELSQQVSFFHKGALEKTIENVPENSDILIDGSRTDFLDKEVLEKLLDYSHRKQTDTNVRFNFTGFNKKHGIENKINFQYTFNKEVRDSLNPEQVLQILKKGNSRFVNGKSQKRDLIKQLKEASLEQFPHSVILGCLDSRAEADIIFDQGFGDLVNIRIGGNIVNDDILGSIEYACRNLGTKLIVVLGHLDCGAIKTALGSDHSGYMEPMIHKIKKSLVKFNHIADADEKRRQLTRENILNSVEEIKMDTNLDSLFHQGKIRIVGAMYDVHTGVVNFYDK